MREIKDLIILTEGGITVFTKVQDTHMREDFFGMLMSALNSFAEEFLEKGLTNLEIGNLRLSVIKRNRFLFVASSVKNVKEKKIIEELEFIIEKFFKLYPKDTLDKWDGDINRFSHFDKEISKSKTGLIEDFISDHWR